MDINRLPLFKRNSAFILDKKERKGKDEVVCVERKRK
jgi:hypothetical protein